jgi:hypothetical protein
MKRNISGSGITPEQRLFQNKGNPSIKYSSLWSLGFTDEKTSS